ncbi:tectonic-1-like [Diadema setosum]|uniref:tectonic-1-like n=1 Tax=Diadema setosum TaxID=31175 RepID=UPI003B3A282E
MAPLSADAKIVLVIIFTVSFKPGSPQTTGFSTTPPAGAGTSAAQILTTNPTTQRAATTQGQPQSTANILTTQPPPTDATEIPPNTDIGICICDLTANGCDVNCCCDPDCTSADISTFSQCEDQTYVVESRVCLRSTVVYSTNAPPEQVDVTDPSLFCIATDNNADRNYYSVPEEVETVERFYELSEKYGDTSYQQPSDSNDTYSDFYKSGDTIYTLYETLALGQLGLPQGLVSDICDDNNPAAYLYAATSVCTRKLTSLSRDCENQPFLSARTYYSGFKFIPTPQFLQDNPLPPPVLVNLTTPSLITTGSATTDSSFVSNATTALPQPGPTTEFPGYGFYDNPELVNISVQLPIMCRIEFDFVVDCNYTVDEIPVPFYNSSTDTCDNVVTEVKYIITHNATNGIETVDVGLTLRSLTSSDTMPSQTFSTEFVKLGETDTFPRSGNPGYVIGQPLVAGNLVQLDGSILEAISLSSDPTNWLTVVRSSADGSCLTDTDSRIPVTFGENLRSGCTIQVSYNNISDICGFIQSVALNALSGNQPGYVATFGNSQPEVLGDWVEIFKDEISGSAVSNEQGVCSNMYMSLHIEVLYANVGALANPQAKIVGVRFYYPDGSGQTLRYQCIGPYCQEGAESLVQQFEVSVSVDFIDTSTSPGSYWAEKPAFQAKLPNDFFYPFTGDSKAVRASLNFFLHSLVFIVSACFLL